MDFDQLRALVAVVDHGTFDAAAKALHVTPSAISQRIKALETTAGAVLLQRTKPVRPSERGTAVLRSARQLLHVAEETAQQLAMPDVSAGGRIRIPIVVNADSIATWFADALTAIGTSGRVELEVRRDDEHVSADLLRSGEVMAAVTTEPTPVQGCSVRRLGTIPTGPRPPARSCDAGSRMVSTPRSSLSRRWCTSTARTACRAASSSAWA